METEQQPLNAEESREVLTLDAFLRPDGSPLGMNLIGMGRTGIVLQEGDRALKIPRLRSLASAPLSQHETILFENEMNLEKLDHELEVFQRLGQHPYIIPWSPSEQRITFPFLRRGDLRRCIQQDPKKPSLSTRLSWIRTIAEALCHCHQQRVLVTDIALRNILCDDHNGVLLIDFADATLFPIDTDMGKASDDGITVRTEIFHFSYVAMSIIVWKVEEHDLYATPPGSSNNGDPFSIKWPPLNTLPPTSKIPLGEIISKCWIPGAYQNMFEVRDDLSRSTTKITEDQA